MSDIALEVEGLSLHFGGVAAVDDLTLQVRAGEGLAVIGPNGAGKSSFVNLISGALPPSSGRVRLFGQDITALSADARARLGIGRTHQIPRPFARMSVRDNLRLAARQARGGHSLADVRERCELILQRCGLAEVAEILAGRLPLLRRKRLELARALALRPRLLLLDEIGAGLVESETRSLIELVLTLKSEVESIVLIEHVMDVVTACCERTAVLATGRLLTIGDTREVLRDPAVAAVYLGSTQDSSVAVASDARAQARDPDAAPLLSVQSVVVNYGGVRALRGVDLTIAGGEVVALLGANGAGKTTLANAISGVVPLQSGSISFQGQRIDAHSADGIAAFGISHCMEGRRIFASLSVEENLLLALPSGARAQARQRLEQAYELFPVLAQRRDKPGTAMSGGQQQMLAIARALMPDPKLVIFDEISLGLAPIVIEQLYLALQGIRARGIAMLLVEQDIERGLQLADRAYVLSHGEVRLQGPPQQIRDAPALRELYVGSAAH